MTHIVPWHINRRFVQQISVDNATFVLVPRTSIAQEYRILNTVDAHGCVLASRRISIEEAKKYEQ